MTNSTNAENNQDLRPTYAFEHVAAKLEPFDLMRLALITGNAGQGGDVRQKLQRGAASGNPSAEGVLKSLNNTNSQRRASDVHALMPIFQTQGLVFPYNPIINEGVSVKYDAIELTHTNESFHAYRGTDNVRISISNSVWTCDTFDNAVYAMAALHFFRTYSHMDFGRGRTGRPPAPMWFSAYGNYAFHRVPVLLEKADWTFPNDVDYVGIPEPGSTEYIDRELKFERDSTIPYTWMPMKFEVSSISLVVQHSPSFWSTWNLDDYRSGRMVREGRKSFHAIPGLAQGRRGASPDGSDTFT